MGHIFDETSSLPLSHQKSQRNPLMETQKSSHEFDIFLVEFPSKLYVFSDQNIKDFLWNLTYFWDRCSRQIKKKLFVKSFSKKK